MKKINKQELGALANCTPNHTQAFTPTWDKINEIVEWITEQEKKPYSLSDYIDRRIDELLAPKPIMKSCLNCAKYKSNVMAIDCMLPHLAIEKCLVNNYKYWEPR